MTGAGGEGGDNETEEEFSFLKNARLYWDFIQVLRKNLQRNLRRPSREDAEEEDKVQEEEEEDEVPEEEERV